MIIAFYDPRVKATIITSDNVRPVNIRAAIIGYWRSGATEEQMWLLTGISQSEIAEIIEHYKKSNAA